MTASLPPELRRRLAAAEHPRELAVDVMFALQRRHGYLNDEAVVQAAGLLGMSTVEIEELATFYTFIYRRPVGRHVIHLCDSLICVMDGYGSVLGHLSRRLGIGMGGTTSDGMLTLLPVCCIGYCDRAPAMLVDGMPRGPLDAEKIDAILAQLKGK